MYVRAIPSCVRLSEILTNGLGPGDPESHRKDKSGRSDGRFERDEEQDVICPLY